MAESENEQELPLSLMGEVILGVALGFTLSLGTFVFMIVSGALGDSRAVLLGVLSSWLQRCLRPWSGCTRVPQEGRAWSRT